MKALLTGATGFVGGHLLRSLISDGIEVHVIHRPASSLHLLDDLQGQFIAHVDDARTTTMIDVVRAAQPEIVYHLAAHYVAVHQPADVEALVTSNILFGTRVFDAMAATDNKNVVMVGTTWQHFSDVDPTPATLYAATKAAQESIAAYYAGAAGFRVAALLISDTYGPHDTRKKLFSLLRESSKSGVRLDMSPGDQVLDLSYIDDTISAIRAAEKSIASEAEGTMARWIVKSEPRLTLREIVATYERTTKRTVPVNWGKKPYRPREVMVPWQNCPAVPGWTPKVTLEQGIARMERDVV